MKKIILILCGLVVLNSSAFGNNFKDVDDSKWYCEWIESIKQLEITTGYPDGSFRPCNQIKRIEMLSLILKALDYDISLDNEYWGQSILDKAVELNIISGESEDLMFTDPDGFITREETARVVYNAYLKENDELDFEVQLRTQSKIIDFEDVEKLYRDGVIGVLASGIVEGYGDGKFNPKSNLTRAEAAVFISRLALSEKRLTDGLDISTFRYEPQSVNSEAFTSMYLPVDQDIYNIMILVDAVENGYVNMIKASDYQIDIYSNQEDFDYASRNNREVYKRWSLRVKVDEPQSKSEDWIELKSYRKPEQLEHIELVKGVFNYLFAEDADVLLEQYFEMESIKTEEDVSHTYQGESFKRKVRIIASSDNMKMLVSRKEDALPVTIEEGRVIINFNGILLDGDRSLVQKNDATDKDSTT